MSSISESTYIHELANVSPNAQIGKNTKIWINSQIRENSVIGQNCIISKDTYIDQNVVIGDNVKIQNGVSIYNGVIIEDDVFVGPNVTFTNDFYPRAFSKDWSVSKTIIRKGASIGANATIICGIEVGEYSMIGAGSVVTKNVGQYKLMVGNPAKCIGKVCKCGYRLKEDKCGNCGFVVKGGIS